MTKLICCVKRNVKELEAMNDSNSMFNSKSVEAYIRQAHKCLSLARDMASKSDYPPVAIGKLDVYA